MNVTNPIRVSRNLMILAALCLTAPGFAASQTDASTTSAQAASSAKSQTSKPSSSAPAPSAHTADHSAQKSKTARNKKTAKKVARKRGQQAIDTPRAREIQTALIREHYLQGQPTGTWDSASQAAMQRYQADHGWQTKTTPDARALIKLGLGPSQDHLLNPESAMTQANLSRNTPTDGTRDVSPDAKVAAKPASAPTPAESNTPKP